MPQGLPPWPAARRRRLLAAPLPCTMLLPATSAVLILAVTSPIHAGTAAWRWCAASGLSWCTAPTCWTAAWTLPSIPAALRRSC